MSGEPGEHRGSAVARGGGLVRHRRLLGGEGGRRSTPSLISMCVQVVGLCVVVVVVAVSARTVPAAHVLLWGALSGVGSATGNLCLYRGLTIGPMNVVAPVSAVVTALLPAVIGLATGDRLSVAGWLGLVLALPSLVLVSRGTHVATDGRSHSRSSFAWGLAAGAGFGLLFIALDRAGTHDSAWPLVPGQLVATVLVVCVALPIYRRERGDVSLRAGMRWGAVSGIGGAGGNLLFLAATGSGELTIASVVTALYPAVTVLLAALLLRERARRTQLVGLAGSGLAVALIAAG